MRDLQIAKGHTWEEKERKSRQFEEERKTNLANKVGFSRKSDPELCNV